MILENVGFTWEPMLIAVIMMALDMIFGFAGAWKNDEIQSNKMREGLWHKAGFCGLIVLALAYEYAASWLNFEAVSMDLGIAVPQIPAVTAVCAFIVLTEIVSILENLTELNEKIAKLPFVRSLVPHDPKEPYAEVEVSMAGSENEDA